VKAENAKLRCALEEHEARFTRLEQRDKEKTNLIAKMDDDIKEIKQSSANASSVENPNNVVRLGKLEKMAKPSNTSDKISEEFEKTVPSGNDQSHVTSVESDLTKQNNDELILEESLDRNQIIEQGLIQELCGTFGTCSSISTEDNISSIDTNFSCNGSENIIS
ncbi:12023_t:CDS:2, partial [Funneliformis geosporum]